MYLCALGEDYYWVKSCIKKRFKYSALDNVPVIRENTDTLSSFKALL